MTRNRQAVPEHGVARRRVTLSPRSTGIRGIGTTDHLRPRGSRRRRLDGRAARRRDRRRRRPHRDGLVRLRDRLSHAEIHGDRRDDDSQQPDTRTAPETLLPRRSPDAARWRGRRRKHRRPGPPATAPRRTTDTTAPTSAAGAMGPCGRHVDVGDGPRASPLEGDRLARPRARPVQHASLESVRHDDARLGALGRGEGQTGLHDRQLRRRGSPGWPGPLPRSRHEIGTRKRVSRSADG